MASCSDKARVGISPNLLGVAILPTCPRRVDIIAFLKDIFSIFHVAHCHFIDSVSILHGINKKQSTKVKAINLVISLVFGLYILDFFLMPFAYGEIDLEKLPFHICTTMCVLSYLSRHTKFFSKFIFLNLH